jgi:EmrB/QacA subfamily drug resistance transporter
MSTHIIQPRVRRASVLAGRWAPLPVVLAGTFMVVLDFFIVNVALPSMQSDLNASNGAIEWVVAGYALTSAVLLITAGRLGDRYGRRRVFCGGLALFTLASAECGIAGSAELLVAARLLQGAAAAILMPNILSIIGTIYTGADRARALTAYGLVMGLAAVSGQLIGGMLVEAFGWRSCFLINLPIGLAALLLAPRVIPETRAENAGRLDVAGTLLVTTGLTAIVLPLVEGRQHGWPAWTWVSLAAAPVILAAFVRHQRGAGAPLIDLGLFRERSFSAGLLTQFTFWGGQASFFLVLALYLQAGRGLSAMNSGLVFTILAGSYLAASMASEQLLAHFGPRMLAGGTLTLAAGHGLLLAAVAEVGVGGSIAPLVPGLLVIGAGMGLVIAPLTTTILATVGEQQAGAASGMLATTQNVGNALGVAITGVIFFGALDGGYAHALQLSLAQLAALLVAAAALTRLLPRRLA